MTLLGQLDLWFAARPSAAKAWHLLFIQTNKQDFYRLKLSEPAIGCNLILHCMFLQQPTCMI